MPNTKTRSSIDSFVIYLTATDAQDARLHVDTDESYRLQVVTTGKRLEVLYFL